MTTNFRRTFGDAASPLPLSYLDENFNQLENTSTSTVTLAGAGLVGYIASGSGAKSRNVQDKLREIEVSTEDFDLGDSDYATIIGRAFTYAESLLPSTSTQADNAVGYSSGSIRIKIPAGSYALASAIDIPPHVVLEGDGSGSTVLVFSYNGSCVTVKTSGGSVTYPYQWQRGGIRRLRIRGDRTKASQILLDLVRFNFHLTEDVEVESSGGDGIKLTECNGGTWVRVRSNGNIGAGWNMIESAGPLPCNANTFVECAGFENDAEGLVIDGAFGNRWFGGVFENNFTSSTFSTIGTSETATMRQVRVTGIARGNQMYGTWFEGEANALVYADLDAANSTQVALTMFGCHFIPKGTGGNTDRAVVVNKGTVAVLFPDWQANSFRTINSSSAPIRVGKANTGRVYLQGVLQTGVGPDEDLMVEDKDGADANLSGLAIQDLMDGATRRMYGRHEVFIEHGQVGQDWYRTAGSSSTDWEEQPFLRIDAANKALLWGDGTNAPDCGWRHGGSSSLKTDDRILLKGFAAFGALDTTPSVSGGNFFTASNGSATTITAFDDGASVQEFTIFFANGNTTIQHNASIKLAGGVDFTGTANDLLTLVHDGTTAYEKCRSVNG